MNRRLAFIVLCISLLVTFISLSADQTTGQPLPLTRVHAHNDYEHKRPLLDALGNGFCSIEADIYLVDGELLVAHNRSDVKPDRTLSALYLEPLLARVKQNGGRVFKDGPPVTLLIDIKSDADSTYAVLRTVLEKYRDMLTEFRPDKTDTKAVTAILSGNMPRSMVEAEPLRLASCDGRPEDLETKPSVHLVPLVSSSWSPMFHWRGNGPFPEAEAAKLKAIVDQAHQQGRRIRFWGAPDKAVAWKTFYEAGVDLINTDDLPGLRHFMVETLKNPPSR